MCSSKNTRSPKGTYWATVVCNQRIKDCYYRVVLELEPAASALFSSVIPGQFAMLDLTQISLPAVESIPDHLKDTVKRQMILRRPFSFSDVSIQQRPEGQIVQLTIMYCVLGPSTVRMTSLSRGDKISLLGPLGNGFQVHEDKEVAILIAGGMGSPPILHLAGVLKNRFAGMKVVVFSGAKSYESMPFTIEINNKTGPVIEEFQQINVTYYLSSDDGSLGFKGYVTSCVEDWLIKNPLDAHKVIIYACGPEPMLAAAARLACKYNIDCQVSMERMMACGIGVCQSCAIEQKTGIEGQSEYRLCCQDGPVFDARQVFFGTEG